jgi:rod shape-determining protein MreD
MRLRTIAAVVLLYLVAIVIQTTLFGRITIVTPDLVMLVSILLALTRIRPEAVLGLAFLTGLIVDLLGSSLLGLRAIVFTVVAYIAVRTRERAEVGRLATALWAGVLTLIGVVLLVLIGTLFNQSTLFGERSVALIFLVPLANAIVAAIFAPLVVRLVNGDRTSFRYA